MWKILENFGVFWGKCIFWPKSAISGGGGGGGSIARIRPGGEPPPPPLPLCVQTYFTGRAFPVLVPLRHVPGGDGDGYWISLFSISVNYYYASKFSLV